jgi:hypothetical protein
MNLLMIFNNPEFTEFNQNNDKQSTSIMDNDDIYDWSRKSTTPTNRLSGRYSQQLQGKTNLPQTVDRISIGAPYISSESEIKDNPKRDSIGEGILTSKIIGVIANPNLQANSTGFKKYVEQGLNPR